MSAPFVSDVYGQEGWRVLDRRHCVHDAAGIWVEHRPRREDDVVCGELAVEGAYECTLEPGHDYLHIGSAFGQHKVVRISSRALTDEVAS